MSQTILSLNAGSSSIKFALFEIVDQAEPIVIMRGEIDDGDTGEATQSASLSGLIEKIESSLQTGSLMGVGHRIVHGGSQFVAPVLLSDDVVEALNALTPLAPLHQPRCLEPIRLVRQLRPHLLQVGCFDTAFHHDLKPPVSRFAIPREYEAKGIRRYGFHGLSYSYIAMRLAELSPGLVAARTVVAHLGNGASLCALRDGRSIDTTMGFTALDGLVMGTRCGAIDPGILLYLQQVCGLNVTEVEHLLYHQSGLQGVSGISGDMRVLQSSTDTRAAEAIDLFVFSVARGIAMMAQTLGGIGEHSKEIRSRVCDQLRWLGVSLNRDANDQAADCINDISSRVDVRIIPTDEEAVIAQDVVRVLATRG